jgi:RNA polymerase-binding transcription factor DksA
VFPTKMDLQEAVSRARAKSRAFDFVEPREGDSAAQSQRFIAVVYEELTKICVNPPSENNGRQEPTGRCEACGAQIPESHLGAPPYVLMCSWDYGCHACVDRAMRDDAAYCRRAVPREPFNCRVCRVHGGGKR